MKAKEKTKAAAPDCAALWKAVPKERRRPLACFLCEVFDGEHGQTKREILAEAKEEFGANKIDWAVILPLIMTYLPMLLALLKFGR